MNLEKITTAIKEAERDGVPLVIRGLFADIPISWDEFFAHMDAEYFSQNVENPPKAEGAIDVAVGNMLVRGRFYFMTRIDPGTSYQHFTNMRAAIDRMNAAGGAPEGVEVYGPAMTFVSLLNEPHMETQIHSDPGHSLYWQVQGRSSWVFYEDTGLCSRCSHDKTLSAIELHPGDFIFAPKGAPHTVSNHGARAAVVFRSRFEDEQPQLASTSTLAGLRQIDAVR